jgi:hypothetical protein
MPLPRQNVSLELASDVLVDFVREHSGTAAFKQYASVLKYRTWFFSPRKKLALLEELFFLHSALARAAIASVDADRSTKIYLRILFHFKLKLLISVLSQDDPTFSGRCKQYTSSYTSLLENGGDAIGLTSIFLSQLYRDPSKGLNLTESMSLLPILLATQKLINDVAASMNVVPSS